MADAPKLLGTDTLRTAYPKVNMAIDNANEALRNSEEALNTANQALANSENTQAQLDQIVIEGDSSVEAAQARVDADGNVFTTLKERLDTKETQFENEIGILNTVKLQTNPRGSVHTTKMIAHRGLSFLAPENTLPAYFEAAKAGFFGAECDVRQTLDGYWVLIHDDTVDRTTDGTGYVKDLTLSELKELDAGSWKDAVYTGTRIPTLGEFLKVCRSTGLVPYIEIKPVCTMPQIISLLDEIKKYFDPKDCVLISVYEQNLLYVRENDKNITLGLVQNITESFIDRVKELGNAFLDVPYTDALDPVKLNLARQSGIDIDVWTVDDFSLCVKLANLGVKGITTNKIPFLKGV